MIFFLFYTCYLINTCDISINFMTHWINERASTFSPFFHSWAHASVYPEQNSQSDAEPQSDHIITLLNIFQWLPHCNQSKNQVPYNANKASDNPFLFLSLMSLTPPPRAYLILLQPHDASLLFLEQVRHTSASGPLHLKILQPRMVFPRYEHVSFTYLLISLFF